MPLSYLTFGADGIALSADGETLYWAPTAGRYLFSIPTARLRNNGPTSELLAQQAVSRITQKGVSDGLETDSNGFIYLGSIEDNAINIFNPANGIVTVYVRDPRIGWTDTMSVSGNYLYFTVNQLWRAPGFQGGVDRRIKPYVLFRVPLANNGTRTNLQ
ncbi:hypothetical protein MMC24_002589 [Lignoscripta atroalba]|nr:hypothetical protein [Lignoscripta atroalba]